MLGFGSLLPTVIPSIMEEIVDNRKGKLNEFTKITKGVARYNSASAFEDLKLSPEVLKALYEDMKFQKPCRIQAIGLPMILTPPYKNLITLAHNDSSKRDFFLIGMLSRVDPKLKAPQAFCVCPTRELAIQNLEVLQKMGKHTGITLECAVPMDSTNYIPIAKRPPVTAQIVIGTPGTIKKWMSLKKLGVRCLKIIVFDEADHMLDQDGFKDDSLRIMKDIKRCNAQCQVLLFSVIFNERLKNFVSRIVGDYNQLLMKELSLESVRQYILRWHDESSKVEFIKDIILKDEKNLGLVIIYVRPGNCASTLLKAIAKIGYAVNKTERAIKQEDQEKIVKEFKVGVTKVLICTDLARGFDQQQVDLVVNYDVPVKHENHSKPDHEAYLQRIVQAGRFGHHGVVVNLPMSESDNLLMGEIVRVLGFQIVKEDAKGKAKIMRAKRFNSLELTQKYAMADATKPVADAISSTSTTEPKKSWCDVAEEEEVEQAAATSEEKEKSIAAAATSEEKETSTAAATSEEKSTEELNVESLAIDESKKVDRFLEEPEDSNIKAVTMGDTPYTSASTFEDLNCSPELLKALYVDMKFQKPSKIQAISLPMILTPPYKNMIAQAHNGSGKTTCFVLGMLSRVDPKLKAPQALCICPTRELAIQNLEVLQKMGKYTGITSECAEPMDSTNYIPIAKRPSVTAQIVIGTPGTIKKWMSAKELGVSCLKILVFDEADHMLAEDGFKDDSLEIMEDVERSNALCQVLLFSSTFNETVKNFVTRIVKDYNQLFVKKEELSLESVKQYKVNCPDELSKVIVIKDRIFELGEKLGQTIIFVCTRNSASALHKALAEFGYDVTTIQGAIRQEDRDKIVKEFKDGLTQVLISTDLLARGFDQQQVNLVINYDLPVKHENHSEPDYEIYFHRIGRAGRFGRKGAVFNLLMSDSDNMLMEKIERHFGSQIVEVQSWNSVDDFKKALKAAGLL